MTKRMRTGAAVVWTVRAALLAALPAAGFAACGGDSSSGAVASAAGAPVEGGDGGTHAAGGMRAGGGTRSTDPTAGAGDGGRSSGASNGGASNGGASDGGASDGGASDGGAASSAGGMGGDGTTIDLGNKLGRACYSTSECVDPKYPALTCVTGKDTVLGNGAPPKGLCTMPCTLPTAQDATDPCEAFGNGALCFPFNSSGSEGYCIEGCSFGEPGLGDPIKCHGRSEFACNPALLGATNDTCKVSADCQIGELCSAGICQIIQPGCLPACSGDVDCDDGMYCDQSFLSGVCVTKKQTGKGLGEPCTVPGPLEPDEPDECLGYCAPDDSGGSQGHCVSTCTYGAPCAYNTVTHKHDGACILINSQIVGAAPGVGDMGYCDLTCNCASECLDAALGCELFDSPLDTKEFRGGGFCLEPTASSVPYDTCAGAGGAGG